MSKLLSGHDRRVWLPNGLLIALYVESGGVLTHVEVSLPGKWSTTRKLMVYQNDYGRFIIPRSRKGRTRVYFEFDSPVYTFRWLENSEGLFQWPPLYK